MRMVTSFCLMLIVSGSAHATVLTFNIDNLSDGSNATVYPAIKSLETAIPDYGDFVSSVTQTSGALTYNYSVGNGFTPNISVAYSSSGNVINHAVYSDAADGNPAGDPPAWRDVVFLWDGNPTISPDRNFYYTFTPTGGVGVRVNSVDLFGGAQNAHIFNWYLYQGSIGGTLLANGTSGVPSSPTIDDPFTITPGVAAVYDTLVLHIEHIDGSGGGIAIDNLNFDEVPIPEPSSSLLLGLSACLLLRRARRRMA